MLTSSLKSDVHKLWDLFWSGGIANPLTAIEQISYLIFMKRLDEMDLKNKEQSEFLKRKYKSLFPEENLRWSSWRHMEAETMLSHVRDNVFPFIKTIESEESSFSKQMKDAVFIIPKPKLLVEAVEVIEKLKISEQNQDAQGDIYEFLLSELQSSGKNGQFRTPRHIIKMMCSLVNPKLGEKIVDPSCGTGGFLIGAYQHILKSYTSPNKIIVENGWEEHGLVGDKLTDKKAWDILKKKMFYGFDFDTTMLRIGTMNMVLHGIETPNILYTDTLSKRYNEENAYDVVLANPPFKGSIDKGDIHEGLTRLVSTTKTELLFLAQIMRMLKTGGRCAVIVPDGVLFGTSNAHVAVRKKIVEECQLEGVISMPGGVFKPYAGVSTAVLIFTKGGETERVFFYDMQADGFSLDDKRELTQLNDIPDIIEKWNQKTKLSEPTGNDKWFWVEKKKIIEGGYDLSLTKYKPFFLKKQSYEGSALILENLFEMEKEIMNGLEKLRG